MLSRQVGSEELVAKAQDLSRNHLAVSVALCTYNGERHLRGQLESITSQTRRPDEVVIGDDGSSDKTLSIIADWIRAAPGPEVRVLERAGKPGISSNFQRTIQTCKGDVILLSDQDDRWRPDRVIRSCRVFENDPGVEAMFSNAGLINSKDELLAGSLWSHVGFTRRMQSAATSGRLFEVLLRRNVATGATMALRSSLHKLAFPIPELWLHDEWLIAVASAMFAIQPIPDRLILYRVHDENQVGLPGFTQRANAVRDRGWQSLEEQILRWRALELRLRHLELHVPADAARAKIEHLKSRVEGKERGLPVLVNELARGRYRRYSNGWRSAVADLARLRDPR